jgi:hypothetical protein
MEWFHKYLQPYISKDDSTSRVTSKEEVIFKSQQLDLIYAQSGMLCKIIPDTPRSSYNPRQKILPHVDGIVGSANVESTKLVTIQLKYLSLSHSVGGKISSMSSTNNQEGITRNGVVIIIRVGRIIIVIKTRTTLTMRIRTIILVRARKKGKR